MNDFRALKASTYTTRGSRKVGGRTNMWVSGNPDVRKEAGGMKANGRTLTSKGTKTFRESIRASSSVQHSPGKNDHKDLGRGRPITRARGGMVGDDKYSRNGPLEDKETRGQRPVVY